MYTLKRVGLPSRRSVERSTPQSFVRSTMSINRVHPASSRLVLSRRVFAPFHSVSYRVCSISQATHRAHHHKAHTRHNRPAKLSLLEIHAAVDAKVRKKRKKKRFMRHQAKLPSILRSFRCLSVHVEKIDTARSLGSEEFEHGLFSFCFHQLAHRQ